MTGALLMHEDCICQTLEGEESVVRSLFSDIARDSRHHAVEICDIAMVAVQPFSRWAMAEVTGTDLDVHLMAKGSGTTITARNGTAAEQDRLLTMMRALALDLVQG